jgi:hypothetical protein
MGKRRTPSIWHTITMYIPDGQDPIVFEVDANGKLKMKVEKGDRRLRINQPPVRPLFPLLDPPVTLVPPEDLRWLLNRV